MARQKLEVTLETVTPLFLAGADGKTPELRPPSFRGAMRFWLRALLGGVMGDDVEAVRRKEVEVFGSTDAASPVIVQVGELQPLSTSSFLPLLHNPQRSFRFPGFKPGQRFVITLGTRPGIGQLPKAAVASLLLLCHLGGVGKRSRRGFGSLQVVALSNSDWAQLGLTIPRDVSDLNGYLEHLLAWSRAAITDSVHETGPTISERLPMFSILSPEHAKILVCKQPFDSWETTMHTFWHRLRSAPYRDKREFGFAGRNKRRASPLLLHVDRIGGKYYLVLTAFRAHLSPRLEGQWDIVARFLDECRNDWDGEYVMGGET